MVVDIPNPTGPRDPRIDIPVTITGPRSTAGMDYYTMQELMSKNFPENDWIIDQLIPEGLTVLSAQPASYKTWLLLDIAISVASGKSLFGCFETKQGGVLMIDEENNARLLQQRLALLCNDIELPIHFMIEQGFKLEDGKVAKIIKFCQENNIRLITFDSLVRIHNSNENDAVQMSEVFAKVRRFTQAGINVLITHHNRKSNSENPGQDMRGSSDILASVDCHLSLKRDRDAGHLVITQTKVRSSQELPPIEMEVLSSDDVVKFEYVGSLKIESKRTKLKSAIKTVLTIYDRLNQKDLLSSLEAIDNKVNAKTLRSILHDMEADEDISASTGKGSEILYELKGQES